jgi:hypothetical protein
MAEPEVPETCQAVLYIGDDHGDNHATMRCQLPHGHEGRHQEEYEPGIEGQKVTVTWTKDDGELEKRTDWLSDEEFEEKFGFKPE